MWLVLRMEKWYVNVDFNSISPTCFRVSYYIIGARCVASKIIFSNLKKIQVLLMYFLTNSFLIMELKYGVYWTKLF
jgi:multisubunit Na+/H+ antiporter MnhG subunit